VAPAVTGAEVSILDDHPAVARAAADAFAREAAAAVAARGRFMVALAGGATPELAYRVLAERAEGPSPPAVPWRSVHAFWGDERWVPPDHPQSNYRMAREALLDHVPIPAAQVHRIESEHQDPTEAAARYERELRLVFGEPDPGGPAFDLVLLGLGADGHTASLFPGTALLAERRRLVAAEWVRAVQDWRITLTPAAFVSARLIVFLATGAAKAVAAAAALGSGQASPAVPASVVMSGPRRIRWILDRAAAARLQGAGPAAVP
jgi:6-phosphogluconolactonase